MIFERGPLHSYGVRNDEPPRGWVSCCNGNCAAPVGPDGLVTAPTVSGLRKLHLPNDAFFVCSLRCLDALKANGWDWFGIRDDEWLDPIPFRDYFALVANDCGLAFDLAEDTRRFRLRPRPEAVRSN
jgi:hypothetical protein